MQHGVQEGAVAVRLLLFVKEGFLRVAEHLRGAAAGSAVSVVGLGSLFAGVGSLGRGVLCGIWLRHGGKEIPGQVLGERIVIGCRCVGFGGKILRFWRIGGMAGIVDLPEGLLDLPVLLPVGTGFGKFTLCHGKNLLQRGRGKWVSGIIAYFSGKARGVWS